jgi:hypothetical protein
LSSGVTYSHSKRGFAIVVAKIIQKVAPFFQIPSANTELKFTKEQQTIIIFNPSKQERWEPWILLSTPLAIPTMLTACIPSRYSRKRNTWTMTKGGLSYVLSMFTFSLQETDARIIQQEMDELQLPWIPG